MISLHAALGPPMAYVAVGMTRALESAIGLPKSSTSALWILVFMIPAEVRRYFMLPLLVANITAFVEQVRAAKPATVKGNYIKSITVAATMTPGIAVTM